MTKGTHRATPNSRKGRQMYRIVRYSSVELTQEQKDWNRAVDEKREAKKQRKLTEKVSK